MQTNPPDNTAADAPHVEQFKQFVSDEVTAAEIELKPIQQFSVAVQAKLPDLTDKELVWLVDEAASLLDKARLDELKKLRQEFARFTWGNYDPFTLIDNEIKELEARLTNTKGEQV